MTKEEAKITLANLKRYMSGGGAVDKSVNKAIDMAIEALGKSEPHWIPVEQELPKLRHDVLLTVFFHEKWNVAEGYRQDGEFMFWNNGRLDSVLDEENRVIAWMPKPEPYKPTVPPECEGDCGWCKPTVIEKCKGVTT